jgi:hypothetical protein
MSSAYAFNRRQLLSSAVAAGALATASPALALVRSMSGEGSAIALLWARAEALKARMAPYAKAIDAAFKNTGTPGWMRLRGPANALGEERYGVLVEILKATPRSLDDLVIQSAATRDFEMIHGPRAWAHGQFDRASSEFFRAA